MNCLSVFDYFVGLVLKGLNKPFENCRIILTSENYLNSFSLSLHTSFIIFKQSYKKISENDDLFIFGYFSKIFTSFILNYMIDLLTPMSLIFSINISDSLYLLKITCRYGRFKKSPSFYFC